MRRLAQGAAYTVMMKLFDSADHVSAKTGATVAITISKAGGAFGNPNAGASSAVEVSSGWYKFALDATDTGTLGDLVVRGTASGADDVEQVLQVVSATTGGASNLDAAISTRASQTSVDDVPTNAELATALAAADDAVLAAIAALNNITAASVWAVGTRELTSGANIVLAKGTGLTGLNDLSAAQVNAEADTALVDYDGPTNAELAAALASADDAVLAQIALVKAQTDNLPSDPADASVIAAATSAILTAVGDVPTNAELATALGTADDAVLAAVAALTTLVEALPSSSDVVDGVVAIDVDGLTLQEALRVALAVLAGKVSGASTATNVIRAVDDSKTRVTSTVDASGNRSAVTVDAAP